MVTDENSRFPIMHIINNLKTEIFTFQLKSIFMNYGLLSNIKTDNNFPMNNAIFTKFLAHLVIKHIKI